MEDLRGNATAEIETSNTPKLMGAVLVVLAVGALGGYTLSSGLWNSPSPREMASREPVPVKITGPVTPIAPAPVGTAVSSPYQHASETTAVKPAARVAHVRKSAPATQDNSAAAPSPPADMATPATTPAPEPASPPPAPAGQP